MNTLEKTRWPKRTIEWTEDNIAYLSIPFTWNLPEAYSRCAWYRQQGFQVRAGGPAIDLMPNFLSGLADIGGHIDALRRHNPNATYTSRGCIRNCSFCAVPKIEGALVELKDWEPKPIVCDNNLLACSLGHFDKVIDSLKHLPNVDFNQGLDARLLKQHHIDRLRELNLHCARLAWDNIHLESTVMAAVDRLLTAGLPKGKIRVYVLVGFDDTPDDALYRCQRLKDKGILPNPQRYQPLDTLEKDTYVSPNWTGRELTNFVRYWSRQKWLRPIPFEEYDTRKRRKSSTAEKIGSKGIL